MKKLTNIIACGASALKQSKAVVNEKKALVTAAVLGTVGSTNSFAADIAYDVATNTFTGDFNLTPYYSAVGILVVALALVGATGLAIKTFKAM